MNRRAANIALAKQLLRKVDAYDNADENLPMQTVAAMNGGGGGSVQPTQIGNAPDNPPFVAQFDIKILTYYFSVAAGAFTNRSAAYILANAPTLATRLAAFVFGIGDFNSGFLNASQQFVPSLWQFGFPFMYGPGSYPNTAYGVLDATAKAFLLKGDVVLPYAATVGGVDYVALVVLRSDNVGYATNLGSTNSDRYKINRIRYTLGDASLTPQYNNAIVWLKQSLYGKADKDNISPISQKTPNQFQAGIVDILIRKEINKEVCFASWINYANVDITWSFFVESVNKLV